MSASASGLSGWSGVLSRRAESEHNGPSAQCAECDVRLDDNNVTHV